MTPVVASRRRCRIHSLGALATNSYRGPSDHRGQSRWRRPDRVAHSAIQTGMVGARGFEPPASRSRTVRSTRLSYAPKSNSVDSPSITEVFETTSMLEETRKDIAGARNGQESSPAPSHLRRLLSVDHCDKILL